MIINKFQSVEHLNEVYKDLFNSTYIQRINSDNFDTVTLNLDDIRKLKLKTIIEENSTKELYVYLDSKTEFKKQYYSHMVTSLYEKYYDSLKNNGIIISATGSYVVIQKTDNIDIVFSDIENEPHIPDMSKVLSVFMNKIDNLEKDNKFYVDHISKLESTIVDMQEELSLIKTNLFNKTISSWY